MIKPVSFVTVMAAISAMSFQSQADVYRYIDASGARFYTNKPVGNYRLLFRTAPLTYREDLKQMPGRRHLFDDIIERVSQKHGMDPKLIHAVIHAESAYNPRAVSSAGAVGLMQLMPDTASRYGVYDRHDPEQNIEAGTRYLKDLLRMFDSNMALAIAGYNAGEGAVIRHNRSIPPYPETQQYVRQVMNLYVRHS